MCSLCKHPATLSINGRKICRDCIKACHPKLPVKIVAEPKENCVDMSRLCAFYESFGMEVVAV